MAVIVSRTTTASDAYACVWAGWNLSFVVFTYSSWSEQLRSVIALDSSVKFALADALKELPIKQYTDTFISVKWKRSLLVTNFVPEALIHKSKSYDFGK